jgi:hypothetical protein
MEPAHASDWKVPARHWTELSEYDRQRYTELRVFFRQQQKDYLRERKSSPFSGEIVTIINFVDQPTAGRDKRCILCGIGCGGPLLAVNTQQLKHLVGRCKSSINTSFQQIGYGVLKNRTKGKEAIWAIVPELRAEPGAIRKWTVRCASDSCNACFCSSFTPRSLPQMLPEDFVEEKRTTKPPPPDPVPWVAPMTPRVTFEPPRFDFRFGTIASDGEDFPSSFSVDFLSGLDPGTEAQPDPFATFFEQKPNPTQQTLPRSQSVNLGFRFQ